MPKLPPLAKFKKPLGIFLIGGLVLLAVLAGLFVTPHHSSWFSSPPPDCPKQTIYLLTNGVHTDIAFPMKDLPPELLNHLDLPNLGFNPEQTLVAFGWGERIFFLEVREWKDLTFSKATKAIFNSPGTLMHVSLFNKRHAAATIPLCAERADALLKNITNSFAENSSKWAASKVRGYSPYDWFFPAKGTYSPIYTCNSWTGEKLRSVNFPTPYLTQFPQAILWHLD